MNKRIVRDVWIQDWYLCMFASCFLFLHLYTNFSRIFLQFFRHPSPLFHASFLTFSHLSPMFHASFTTFLHLPSINQTFFSYVTTHLSLFCTEIFYFQIFLFHTLLTNLKIPFSPLLTLFWQNHQSSPISIIFSTLLRPIQQSKVNLCQIWNNI